MTFLFTNMADSRLFSAIDSTASAIAILSGDGSKFPAFVDGRDEEFRAVIWNDSNIYEIVGVKGRVGDTFINVERGLEETKALPWEAGAHIALRVTAEIYSKFTAVSSHTELSGLSVANQHPISAITGLQSTIDSINSDILSQDTELSSHTGNSSNPHSVTAEQVGAPTTSDLWSHTGDTTNPHSVTAAQVGAPTTTDLSNHTGDFANPHAVTAAQVGAATTSDLSTHTGDTSNPHAVTAAQAGADPSGTAATAVSTHEGAYDHIQDASSDSKYYCRYNGAWVEVPSTTLVEYAAAVSGTGDVWTDANSMDFTGHPYAGSNTYISIEANHIVTVTHNGNVYRFVGSKPFDLGLNGDTSVSGDYIQLGSSDHSALSNRTIANQHPTSAIDHSGTALSTKVTGYDNHLASSSNPHAVTAAQVGAATTGDLASHTGDTSNPHEVTAAQIGAEPEDSTILRTTDIHQTEVNDAVNNPISSEWAFEHRRDNDAHGTDYSKTAASGTSLDENDDLDTIKTAGWYKYGGGSVPLHAPPQSTADYALMYVDRDGGNWRQILWCGGVGSSDAQMFCRRANSGVLGDWTEFLSNNHRSESAAHAAAKLTFDPAINGNKISSTIIQGAIDENTNLANAAATAASSHASNTQNPHGVTYSQVGAAAAGDFSDRLIGPDNDGKLDRYTTDIDDLLETALVSLSVFSNSNTERFPPGMGNYGILISAPCGSQYIQIVWSVNNEPRCWVRTSFDGISWNLWVEQTAAANLQFTDTNLGITAETVQAAIEATLSVARGASNESTALTSKSAGDYTGAKNGTQLIVTSGTTFNLAIPAGITQNWQMSIINQGGATITVTPAANVYVNGVTSPNVIPVVCPQNKAIYLTAAALNSIRLVDAS